MGDGGSRRRWTWWQSTSSVLRTLHSCSLHHRSHPVPHHLSIWPDRQRANHIRSRTQGGAVIDRCPVGGSGDQRRRQTHQRPPVLGHLRHYAGSSIFVDYGETKMWFQRTWTHVHVRYMSSAVRLSVMFVRPTPAIEIFGNVSTLFGTLAICWHPGKILRRSYQRNPSGGGVKHTRGIAEYSDFGHIERYISETVQDES